MKDLDLPLKHNQLVVAKFISQVRVDDCYWCKDLLAAENNEGRHKILKLEVSVNIEKIIQRLGGCLHHL